jgi:short-subunit dehydrogenase
VAAAGFGISGSFLQPSVEEHLEMLAVNCGAVVALANASPNEDAAASC